MSSPPIGMLWLIKDAIVFVFTNVLILWLVPQEVFCTQCKSLNDCTSMQPCWFCSRCSLSNLHVGN